MSGVPDYAVFLSPSDCDFMHKNGLNFRDVFDARGMAKRQYSKEAKLCNSCVVFVGRACNRGHFLKLRTGHCPICRPSSFGFSKRYAEPRWVYIAHSPMGRLIKIGIAECVETRLATLVKESYAGFSDWKMKYTIWSESAGKLEADAQTALAKYRMCEEYYYKGQVMLCAREVFRTSVRKARSVLEEVSARIDSQ
ncbi:GIY-YIG nuclease family protein [Limnobacter sp.]|uniref:GIY-YIG nuclease family protein n=1 Tax=Limnobacter sp. TaxID=2003368 RepID=UPI00338EDEA8